MPGTAEGAAKARARREAASQPLELPRMTHAPKVSVASSTEYIVGLKPIKHGDRTYNPGEPFDVALPRIESWVRTGRLIAV